MIKRFASTPEALAYYDALGKHLASLRKARGFTQAELGRAVGVSQQAVFAYEINERRVSIYILIKLAKVFSTSVDELIGIARPLRIPKRRLSPRAMRHAARLQKLPTNQKRFVLRILDMLEASNAHL